MLLLSIHILGLWAQSIFCYNDRCIKQWKQKIKVIFLIIPRPGRLQNGTASGIKSLEIDLPLKSNYSEDKLGSWALKELHTGFYFYQLCSGDQVKIQGSVFFFVITIDVLSNGSRK